MSNFVLTPNAVAKLRRAIAPRSGNTGAVAATGVPIDLDKFPPPFTVRWSASAASGAGAWVIWLPDKAQLVMLKDAYITPTGVTAEQALPTGWYTIDDATASSTEVYLNITIPETGTPSAEISTTQGQSTTGETVMSILVAEMETDAQTGAKRVKQYVDSAALVGSVKDGESGADAGIYITQEPIAPSTDHPGGGVQITFQPLQDGQPHGQPTVVTLWNGSGGGGGGTDLSDTPALDVVPSTGQASAGVAVTASRQDHVHKMPATVVLTDVDQVINSNKVIRSSAGSTYARLDLQHTAGGNTVRLQHELHNGQELFRIYLNGIGPAPGNIIAMQGTVLHLGARGTGKGAIDDVRLGEKASAALENISPTTSSRRITTVQWVTSRFQQKLTAGSNITISGGTISATQPTVGKGTLTIKQGGITLGTFNANQGEDTTVTISAPPSGTVEFVADIDWYVNGSTHQIRKRLRVLNLATGAITDKAGTTYANGWEVAANTTPISSIIPQSS